MSAKWRKLAAGLLGAAGAVYLLLVVQLFVTGIDEFEIGPVMVRLRPWWKPLWIGLGLLILLLGALEEEPAFFRKSRERLASLLGRLGFSFNRPGQGWALAGGFIGGILAWGGAESFYYLAPSPSAAPVAAALGVLVGAGAYYLFFIGTERLFPALKSNLTGFRVAAGRAALYLTIWGLLITFPLSNWEALGTDPIVVMFGQAILAAAILCWLILSRPQSPKLGRARKITAAAVAVLIVAGGIYDWRVEADRAQGPGPDRVLLITMDTTRADYLSVYGFPKLTSPNLDALAKSGVRFTAAFCPEGITDPSHASVLTGTYPRTHGLTSNYKSVIGKVGSLAAEFQDRGYLTACITSRAHLHPVIMNIPGFDIISSPSLASQDTSAFDAYRRIRNFLLHHRDQDVFIWLHFFDPHGTYRYHPGYSEPFVKEDLGPYVGREEGYRGHTLSEEELTYARGLYAGEINYMDHYIGKSIDTLRTTLPQPRREPFILAIADHGECLGEYRDRRGRYTFGHGGVLYNASARIPLIVAWPGHIPPGVVDQVSGSVDVAPTMLDYVLGYTGFNAQGHSLRALIEATDDTNAWTVSFRPKSFSKKGKFYATHHYAFIRGPYKFIRWDSGETELYDFRNDYWEEHDLTAEKPQVIETYNHDLDQWFEHTPKSKGKNRELSKGEINVLKALGYIQ